MRRPRLKPHQLQVYWDKRDGLSANLEPRFDNASLRYILCEVLNDDVIAELKSRGFDPKTIRLTIDRTPEKAAAVEAMRTKATT